MPLQALYLSEEIIEHLKKEPNMSKLVNSLLYEYYDLVTPIDEKLAMAKKELDNKMQEYQRVQEIVLDKDAKEKDLEKSNKEQFNEEMKKLEQNRLLRIEYDKYLTDNNKINTQISFEKWKSEIKYKGVVKNEQIRN